MWKRYVKIVIAYIYIYIYIDIDIDIDIYSRIHHLTLSSEPHVFNL